jgi:dihydrofolate reductase
VCHTLEEVLTLTQSISPEELFVIGGAEIYALMLPFCLQVRLTRVQAEVESDTFFPTLSETQWKWTELTPWETAASGLVFRHETAVRFQNER